MSAQQKIDKAIATIEDIVESMTSGHCNRNANLIYLEKTLVLLNELKAEISNEK